MVFSLAWIAAWVLDPMVSLVLVAVLRAEQVTARYQVDTGLWVRGTKVFAFAATYVMNTWASWQALDPSGIVLHSVPPFLVYCAAEAGPILRDRLTEAVLRAARMTSLATATAEQATNPAATPEPAATTPTTHTSSLPAAVDPLADTVELPVIRTSPDPVDPAPRPTAPARTTSTPRARPTRPAKPGKRGKATKPPVRSMADLRSELDTAIQTGEVDSEPSAEQIRKALRISPDRARALRDERRDDLRTPPPAPVDISTQPAHNNDSHTDDRDQSTEVTRDAA
jgi:hypothetical protein